LISSYLDYPLSNEYRYEASPSSWFLNSNEMSIITFYKSSILISSYPLPISSLSTPVCYLTNPFSNFNSSKLKFLRAFSFLSIVYNWFNPILLFDIPFSYNSYSKSIPLSTNCLITSLIGLTLGGAYNINGCTCFFSLYSDYGLCNTYEISEFI
jgi:hypothetical protein